MRAKMRCTEAAQFEGYDPGEGRAPANRRVRFMPVAGTEGENAAFGAATPSGSIELTITAEAARAFEVGREYYVDFSPA